MILVDEALFIKIGQGFGKQVGEGREICICLPQVRRFLFSLTE